MGLETGRHRDDTTVPGFTIERYRPRIEGLFARIERWTEAATGDVHWRSITGDHVTTAGGRVLAVSGLGEGVAAARTAAYAAADEIAFEQLHRREDIAAEVPVG